MTREFVLRADNIFLLACFDYSDRKEIRVAFIFHLYGLYGSVVISEDILCVAIVFTWVAMGSS